MNSISSVKMGAYLQFGMRDYCFNNANIGSIVLPAYSMPGILNESEASILIIIDHFIIVF